MLLIGSQALHVTGFLNDLSIVKSDWDFIVSSEEEWECYRKSFGGVEIKLENPKSRAFYAMVLKSPHNLVGIKTYYECTIAEPGSSDQMLLDYAERNCLAIGSTRINKIHVATPEMILAIKLSHRYKKNTPFFRKTMNHIRFMRSRGVKLNDELEAISCVLALERSQIPNDFSVDPNKIFLYALEKVCTSITSGWFREFAWENYHLVVKMHDDLGRNDYIKRYKKNIDMIKPFNK